MMFLDEARDMERYGKCRKNNQPPWTFFESNISNLDIQQNALYRQAPPQSFWSSSKFGPLVQYLISRHLGVSEIGGISNLCKL